VILKKLVFFNNITIKIIAGSSDTLIAQVETS
jgi:hypothetical protein